MMTEIVYRRPEDLKPYEANAKIHTDEQVQFIANSISEFGFKTPIVIDKDGVIIQGHGRLLASNLLELETVPCIIADDLTDEQVKMLRLADNKVAESGWDQDLLSLELEDLMETFDIEDFGFDLPSDEDPDLTQETGEDLNDFPIKPLSVIDTRSNDWIFRREKLLKELDLTLYEDLMSDPVLTEMIIRWYGVENGTIFGSHDAVKHVGEFMGMEWADEQGPHDLIITDDYGLTETMLKWFGVLNDNRFVAVVTDHPQDTMSIMTSIGYKYHTEIIMIEDDENTEETAVEDMSAYRTIGKIHKNVILFCKGSAKKAQKDLREI